TYRRFDQDDELSLCKIARIGTLAVFHRQKSIVRDGHSALGPTHQTCRGRDGSPKMLANHRATLSSHSLRGQTRPRSKPITPRTIPRNHWRIEGPGPTRLSTSCW